MIKNLRAIPKQLPSRFDIGDTVLRCATEVRSPEGFLQVYEAEPARVTSVHFYEGKVVYGVRYAANPLDYRARTDVLVDSTEVEDLPPEAAAA